MNDEEKNLWKEDWKCEMTKILTTESRMVSDKPDELILGTDSLVTAYTKQYGKELGIVFLRIYLQFVNDCC